MSEWKITGSPHWVVRMDARVRVCTVVGIPRFNRLVQRASYDLVAKVVRPVNAVYLGVVCGYSGHWK